MDTKKLELKMLVEELEKIEGRRTELISYYIPAGYDLSKVMEHLSYEYSTAQNIKDKTTRQNVSDALAKIINYLKGLKKIPDNGLVIFCGNIAKNPGETDIRLWAIEPPEPLSIRLYRCDSRFVLDPLKDMLEEKVAYGLIVLDRGEATIGLLKGNQIIVLENKESWVPSKIRDGGSSSVRFQRLIEQSANEWLKYLADKVKMYFDRHDIVGIIVGGPGPTKETFIKEFLPYPYNQKVLGVFDTGYSNEYGLKELVERAKNILQQTQYIKEVEAVQLFFEHLSKNTGLAIYGEEDVIKALEMGAVEKILLSEEYKDRILEFTKLAEQSSAELIVISKNHPEGEQFSLFKIAAILRYRIY